MSKTLSKKQIITKLRDDKNYFGELGKQYMSNSDFKVLNTDFESYGAQKKNCQPLEEGSYFHALLLEPEKAKNFPIWTDTETRGVAYKEYLKEKGLDFIMKTSEAEEIQNMVHHFLNKPTNISEILNDKSSKKEEPMIGKLKINDKNCATIHNKTYDIKGKADLIGNGVVIDFKTTNASQVEKFIWDARSFGYDSQGFIYNHLFQLPVIFIAISKIKKHYGTNNIPFYKIFCCKMSKTALESGHYKVKNALQIYEAYYGKNATESLEGNVYQAEF
tara:strand:- start:201 stop:1025 length:825 start_codon:yes stop_codon:yes gene_type:complete